jgi:hypothetical protein
MKKIYKTYKLKSLVIPVNVGDSKISVEFKGGCMLGSTATYVTANERIQNELESLTLFKRDFYLENVIIEEEVTTQAPTIAVKQEPVVEEEKEVVDILDAQTFKNLVELRNALQEKGIDVSQITNVKAAENIAKKNGYNYTVEKNA